MKYLIFLSGALFLLTSCNKHLEKAARLSGVWELRETVVTKYAGNEPVSDSTVQQSGVLTLETTGDYDNVATTDIPYMPCLTYCFWDIPKGKADQIFFYYHDESTFTIFSASCMIEKSTSKKLVLMSVSYDGDLNIMNRVRWEFRKAKL